MQIRALQVDKQQTSLGQRTRACSRGHERDITALLQAGENLEIELGIAGDSKKSLNKQSYNRHISSQPEPLDDPKSDQIETIDLQSSTPINNQGQKIFQAEYGHFQNEKLQKEFAAEKSGMTQDKGDSYGIDTDINKEMDVAQLGNKTQTSNVNIQILGSIVGGYGFLPNFSLPNDLGLQRNKA